MVRRHIFLETDTDNATFFKNWQTDVTDDRYTLENADGTIVVNARSLLGVIYLESETDRLYLVNNTRDGVFPEWTSRYCR